MFELIPAIDVLDGKVVRLERGQYDAVTVYAEDPVQIAEEFAAAGASMLHIVDLEGARSGTSDRVLRRRLAESGVPFQTGGGLRTAAAVVDAVEDGASRAVIGTAAVWSEGVVGEMIAAVGASRIVAAVDVAEGRARGVGWLDEGRPVADVVADLVGQGIERALVTAIARDGMMSGPDLDLLEFVAAEGLTVIASGGVGSLADLAAIRRRGLAGAIVGRALYEGRFTVEEAIASTA
ncbi:MAG: 1-(5-phosphoribosyl)-5-[(5-phosphoribosylamino)methylideneamino] imidazole-4-carboxamide isomerase [Acidimicrobiia bacterium]|nr:1-(5-phosphoribosyl)-5-[(5-phosphoribosylamino)methylideneamino] imidazole-4-carboxamide isomerase [Acidimicrobiia bacterium]